ncbi:MAG: hypothetical protein Roseis2KO_02500 [Roseivirga sp.]
MKILFRALTLIVAGLLVYSFGSGRNLPEMPEDQGSLANHITATQDTLDVLALKMEEIESQHLYSLLRLEQKKLSVLRQTIDSAGIAEIYVAHQTCDEISHWVGLTLKSLSGGSE